MDLVDEQYIALLQIGEQGGKVAGLFNGRAAGNTDLYAHFVGNDACQCGLAKARRAVEQDVVHRFAAPLGSFQIDFQVLLDLRDTSAAMALTAALRSLCVGGSTCHILQRDAVHKALWRPYPSAPARCAVQASAPRRKPP